MVSQTEVKEAFEYINENEPLRQTKLEEELKYEKDEIQEIVRQLRNNDLACYNLARKVESTSENLNSSNFKMFP